MYRVGTEIHQWEWSTGRPWEESLGIESETFEDCGNHIRWGNWPFNGKSTNGVAFPDDSAALYASASEGHGEALWPVVSASSGVDFWSSAEFGECGDEGVSQKSSFVQVFNEGTVSLVVHGGDLILHLLDGDEGFGAVDVPGEFIEDCEEAVDGDEPDSVFDESAGKQAALAKAVHAVAFPCGLLFLRKVEGSSGLFTGHHAKGSLEVVVEESGVFAGFKVFDGAVDDLPHFASAVEPGGTDEVGGEKVGNFEIFFGGIGVEGEGVVGFAEKTSGLAVREIATAAAHEFW